MTLANRLAKIEKALANKTVGRPSQVPDDELHAVIAGIARNRAKWISLESAQRIVSSMAPSMPLEAMSDAQLEAYIVVLDSKL